MCTLPLKSELHKVKFLTVPGWGLHLAYRGSLSERHLDLLTAGEAQVFKEQHVHIMTKYSMVREGSHDLWCLCGSPGTTPAPLAEGHQLSKNCQWTGYCVQWV